MLENAKAILTERYARFAGRAGFAEWWMWLLFSFGVKLVVGVVLRLFSFRNAVIGVAMALVEVGLLLPSLAVAVRRLHDVGRGGGWVSLLLVPVVGWVWLFVLLVQPGEAGANRFDGLDVQS